MRLDNIAKAYYAMRLPNRYPAMETIFGSHSQNIVTESIYTTTDYSENEPYAVSPEKAHKLHELHKMHDVIEPAKEYAKLSLGINSALHHHYGSQFDPKQDWSKDKQDDLRKASLLDSHLQNHLAVDDFHVYTGLPYSPFRHAVVDSGNHMLHLPAFTSTSTNFKKALFFSEPDVRTEHDPTLHGGVISPNARHVLKLIVPKGTQIASIRHFATHKNEDEMLVNRGYDISVNPNPIHAKGETSSPTYVWSATLVKRRPKPIPAPQATRLVV